jgi:hypothetical protein
VAERLNAPVSKTGMGGYVHRGFESLPLRCIAGNPPIGGQFPLRLRVQMASRTYRSRPLGGGPDFPTTSPQPATAGWRCVLAHASPPDKRRGVAVLKKLDQVGDVLETVKRLHPQPNA